MKTKYLFFFFCLFFSCTSFSQTLDSLSSNSSFPDELPTPNQELDISSSTTIITADEILERGYDNLDELLSSVQGIYISHDRTLTQIGMRGPSPTASNNQRMQLLLNGVPLNNPFTGQAPSGYDLQGINMEDIAEVIIHRNPSPVENGNNAMVGLIEINTKQPKKGLRLNFDTGSFGEYDGGFSVGQKVGKATIGLSGRLADVQGQEIFFAGDSVLSNENIDYQGLSLRVNLGKFSFNGNYFRRNETVPSVPNYPSLITVDPFFFDPDIFYTKQELDMPASFQEQQWYFDASFSSSIGTKQSMEVRLFMNYNQQGRKRFYRDTEFLVDSISLDTLGYVEYEEAPEQRTLWAGIDYRHHFQLSPQNKLTIGTVLQGTPFSNYQSNNSLIRHFDGSDISTEYFTIDVLSFMAAKEERLVQQNFPFWSTSLFIVDKAQLNDWLTINAGARLDITSQAKPVIAPQVAIQFSPFENRSKFILEYSRGYRLPSLAENDLVISDNATNNPNPTPTEDLVPETSDNFEFGFIQKIGKDLDLNLTFYHQNLNDLIWNETTMINRQNDKVISTTGLEGGLGVSLPKGIRSYLNYNFQLDQNEKVNLPSPLCKFGFTIPFLKHFLIFAEGQYEGTRLTFDGSYTHPYFLMNTNLLIRPQVVKGSWLEGLSWSFRLYNIFDEFYQHPSGQAFTPNLIPQNGRTWQTQLTYQF